MAGGAALSMATAYLQVSLLLQAALGAWLFESPLPFLSMVPGLCSAARH